MTTKAERAWMDAISELGCIVCRTHDGIYTPGHFHHILKNGKRIDHLHTLCLCPTHHNTGIRTPHYVSRHPWKREFERRYGTEQSLLEETKKMIKVTT